MKQLIDTNIVVDFFRRKEKSKKLIESAVQQGILLISIITYGELVYGTYRSKNQKYEEKRINRFIEDFQIQIISLTEKIMKIYAKNKFLLEKKGTRLDEFDLLIGATAIETKSLLLTRDIKHFKRLPKLHLFSFNS